MTTTCHFCKTQTERPAISADRFVNGNHWFANEAEEFGGHYERIDFCMACRPLVAKAPRAKRTRQPRQHRHVGDVGGWWALAPQPRRRVA